MENRQPIYDALIAQNKAAEAEDLKKLHVAQDEEKASFSDLCRHFITMDENTLKCCGHKSIEAALLYTTKAHVKSLNKLVSAHIKKYPD